jgi:hypothetical protein
LLFTLFRFCLSLSLQMTSADIPPAPRKCIFLYTVCRRLQDIKRMKNINSNYCRDREFAKLLSKYIEESYKKSL